MAKILVIDDNETVREGIAAALHRKGHKMLVASGGAEGIAAYRAQLEDIDLVITDLKMTPVDGMTVLREVQKINAQAMVIIITAHGTVKTAVHAMRNGAFDFIEKPFPVDLLHSKVARTLTVREEQQAKSHLERENEYLRDVMRETGVIEVQGMIGESEVMKRIYSRISKVAPTDSTVHIFGESGTGKELVANAIHEKSRRKNGPFVKINCSAIPDTLLESELFGHERGAFTGAIKRRIGRFELANKGTIFLDEIGEISMTMQVKLLRVLQDQTFQRVGGEKTVQVDVRIITATNRELKEEIRNKRFREDLYYRLNIIPIILPPLRKRPSDIPLLADHFIQKLRKRTRSCVRSLSIPAKTALQSYSWPGNVRELENALEQAMVFAEQEELSANDLPTHISGIQNHLQIPEGDRTLTELLEDLERQLIQRAYTKAKGVKTETARILGIKTPALYYKLDKYNIGEIKR